MAPVPVQAGDIILFPHGDAHAMASSGVDGPRPLLDLQALLRERTDELQLGGGGDAHPHHLRLPVVRSHPVPAGAGRAAPSGDGQARGDDKADWLERSFVYAVAEAAGTEPGGEGVLAKLSEVLVVETLRRYIVAHARGPDRLARGLARSRGRQVPGADAREAGAPVDARDPGARGGQPRARCWPRSSPTTSGSRRSSTSASGAWRWRRICCGAAPEPDADRARSRL